MDLKRKLARLQSVGLVTKPRLERPIDPAGSDRSESLRTMLQELIARQQAGLRRPPTSDVRSLPGTSRDTPTGTLCVVEDLLAPDHHHGRVPIARALEVDADRVAKLALDVTLAGVDFRRALFLDTETTGLTVGAGTIAFLVGLAWFEDGCLRMEQLFLPEPGGEGPLLDRLAERIALASCVVSYNGKAYDWPLLKSRFVMNRREIPRVPAHLDLLHCARRVFKRRLGSVRLVEVEERVLGFAREHDIEGREIPGLYWSYVREHASELVAPILEHNAKDIIALAAILARLDEHFEVVVESDDPLDHLSLAQLSHRARDEDRALRFAEAAALGGGGSETSLEALLLSAKLWSRRREHEQCEEALLRALDAAGEHACRAATVHLALSKHYEHRAKDLEKARIHASHTASAEGEAQQHKRLLRLDRRIARLCTRLAISREARAPDSETA